MLVQYMEVFVKIKVGLLLSLSLLNLTSFAHVTQSMPASDFYIGAGLQRDYGDVNFKSQTNFVLGLVGSEFENADISATGWSGTGVIGLGFPLQNQFYLGMEAEGSTTDQEGTYRINSFFHDGPTQILSFNARIKYNDNYGIFLRPGYYVTPNCLLFLKTGYMNSSFEVAAVPGELGATVPSLNAAEINKREWGLVIGGGIDFGLFRNLSGRVEYDFARYSEIDTNTLIQFLIPETTTERVMANTQNEFSPKNSVITIGLTYSFGFHF